MKHHLTAFSLAQIDLGGNQLCGVDRCGRGTYTAEGIKAIASAISVSASLTSIDLRKNQLGYQGAMHIAKGIAVSASLTSIDLSDNNLDDEAAEHIAKAISVSASLIKVLAF